MAAWSAEQRARWAVLVAAIWVQAFTGTNFDFSAYSSSLKSVLGISQVQLNYLAVASDMGKALGWSSGLALLHLPLWAVLLLSCAMGLVGYGLQWLLLAGALSLSYFSVFFLCLLAGCSICWFNTTCFVLCIRNFPSARPLALSLTVSFNGVSAALYTLMADALSSQSSPSLYLLLNATVPIVASLLALIPILRQPSPPHPETPSDDRVFLVLNALAFLTGLYLLLLNSAYSTQTAARIFLVLAILLLALPLFVPGLVCGTSSGRNALAASATAAEVDATTTSPDDMDLTKGLLSDEKAEVDWCESEDECNRGKGLAAIGQEHTPGKMVATVEFWLYYISYFCGATVGLIYSNNLGQIAQSLGREAETTMLVSVYSACSFFGRLLSSVPDFLNRKFHLPRTGWLAIALVPMPCAYFLLAATSTGHALIAGTALTGLSSGFIFAAAVSVTSDLFGPNSIGLNHNILITNIPLGSLLYGMLAAVVYDDNGASGINNARDGAVVCMGRKCYAATFVAWGCISLIGLTAGVVLFLRTRAAYGRSERAVAVAGTPTMVS